MRRSAREQRARLQIGQDLLRASARSRSLVAALLGTTNWSLQPSSRKPCTLQAALDVRTLTHQPPDEARAVILDHGDDWTLIDAEVVVVEPADAVDDVALLCAPAGVVIGGVEGVEKSVLAEERITVFAAHRPQGGHGNLGSERQRASRSGRRKRAVVAKIGGGR